MAAEHRCPRRSSQIGRHRGSCRATPRPDVTLLNPAASPKATTDAALGNGVSELVSVALLLTLPDAVLIRTTPPCIRLAEHGLHLEEPCGHRAVSHEIQPPRGLCR